MPISGPVPEWLLSAVAALTLLAEMFTSWAPWYVAKSEDKKRVRLNIISHLLSKIPYENLKREKIKLPDRQTAQGYRCGEVLKG